MNKHSVLIIIILALAVVSCNVPIPSLSSEGSEQSGSLVIKIAQGEEKALSGGAARAISANVATVQVKLTNQKYPSLLASAAYNLSGTTISIEHIKVATWAISVYLNDSSGNTLYFGEGSVDIQAGITVDAPVIRVYSTGGVNVTLTEGVVAPTFVAGVPNQAAQTVAVTMTLPSNLSTTARICFEKGASPADPTFSSQSYSTPIVLGFTEKLKAITVMNADNAASAVVTFSHRLPYFTPAPGSYTGFTAVTLQCMLTGATIRYTTDGSDPTYDYGNLAGNGSIVTLTQPTSVLKAISFTSGQPTSVSEIASATYTLNVAPLIVVKQGSSTYTSGSSSYDFGCVAPGSQSSPVTFSVGNDGNGADLALTGAQVALGGTNPSQFTLDTSTLVSPIPLGRTTSFSLAFKPTTSGSFNGTISITSDSSSNPTFTFAATGLGNTAPTLSWLTGLDVQGAGTSAVNGLYASDGTLNGYTRYTKVGSPTYYVYYNNSMYFAYLIADSTTADMYDSPAGHTRMYRKVWSTTSPIGRSYSYEPDPSSDEWTPNVGSWGSAPYVSSANGVGGYPKYSTAYALKLTAYYQYQDNQSDAESGTTFQWYSSTNSAGPWTAVTGATSSTYTVTGTDPGKYFCVDVTPRQALGGLAGATLRSPVCGPIQ